jgi:hypothetical protein
MVKRLILDVRPRPKRWKRLKSHRTSSHVSAGLPRPPVVRVPRRIRPAASRVRSAASIRVSTTFRLNRSRISVRVRAPRSASACSMGRPWGHRAGLQKISRADV